MAKAKSKKRATAATRSAKKNVAALVRASEAKKRGKATTSRATEDPESVPSTRETGTSTSGKQRWKGMSIEQLQVLYAQTLGRPTASDDRMYLIWKIREAEKGNVPLGPTTSRKLFEGPTTAVTMKFEETFLDELDGAAKDDGFKSRLGYLRQLIAKGLETRGRTELAAKVLG